MSVRIHRHRLHRDRRGVTAIEYGLIAAAIIVAIIGILRVTGTDLDAVFGRVDNGLTSASQTVFGKFETITGASNTGFCASSLISGFASGGGVISNYQCGKTVQSTVYTDLTSNTLSGVGSYFTISNPPSGKPITVPPLQGAGTGFTIPADTYVILYKSQSGASRSFYIGGGVSSLTSAQISSVKSACSAEQGSYYVGSSDIRCNGGTLYTGTQVAAALPPQ